MASQGPIVKEEYIDTFLDSIPFAPNAKKVAAVDSEKLKLKIKAELAELGHRVAHRAHKQGPEYHEPVYQEIERRRQGRSMATVLQSPLSDKYFVHDDRPNHIFSQQETAQSAIQARNAPRRGPSARTNDLHRDKFINKIVQFQRSKQISIPNKNLQEFEPTTSQVFHSTIKTENVQPFSASPLKRTRSKLARRHDRSSTFHLSPPKRSAKKINVIGQDDINIVINCSSLARGRKIRLGTEHSEMNITFTNQSKSSARGRNMGGSPRELIDRCIPNLANGHARRDRVLKIDDQESNKPDTSSKEDTVSEAWAPSCVEGESLWDYIATNY